jgi:hypothetical protein
MTIHAPKPEAPKPESFGGDSGPNRSSNEVTYFTVMRGVNSFPVEQLVNRSDSVFLPTLIAADDEHFGRRTVDPETVVSDDAVMAKLKSRWKGAHAYGDTRAFADALADTIDLMAKTSRNQTAFANTVDLVLRGHDLVDISTVVRALENPANRPAGTAYARIYDALKDFVRAK